MRILVTGHTGFKGAWLSLWLAQRGHQVSGLALDPVPGALFQSADLRNVMEHDIRGDIRSEDVVNAVFKLVQPEAVVHLAAQPLVRESYLVPRETIETNVMGTLNVLEAVTKSPTVLAHLVITTDKVYRNTNRTKGYREEEPLGGEDPYSASKAMADILTHSWTRSFPGATTATARAGNVIGGGDVSTDRLLPDLLRSFASGNPAVLRYPSAVRPWQHVLDCLNGYQVLLDELVAGRAEGEWNFGPGADSFVQVGDLASQAADLWGENASWIADEGEHAYEANLLALDATKAEAELGWKNRLSFADALAWTIDWHKEVVAGLSPREATLAQIGMFERRYPNAAAKAPDASEKLESSR